MVQALDYSMRLLGEIAVLLGAYKLRILAVGDFLTDVSTILVFVCKNRVILVEFQHTCTFYLLIRCITGYIYICTIILHLWRYVY